MCSFSERSFFLLQNISGKNLLSHNGHVDVRARGTALFSDVNQIFYDCDSSKYGFEIYSQNGITYYRDQYYRTDIIDVTKKYSSNRIKNIQFFSKFTMKHHRGHYLLCI